MNMPFELGIDHACAEFGHGQLTSKAILVLECEKYDYQKVISDIAGWDIEAHDNDFVKVVRIVRNWLIRQANAEPVGPAKIQGDYLTFQEWYWEREIGRGSSEDDILTYPTLTIVEAMADWVEAGKPVQWKE